MPKTPHMSLDRPQLDRLGPPGRIAGDDHARLVGRLEVDADATPGRGVVEGTVGREREAIRVPPDVAHELGALAAEEEDAVTAPPPVRDPRHVADETDTTDERRRRDRAPARLVVERDVAGDDRDAERVGRLGD